MSVINPASDVLSQNNDLNNYVAPDLLNDINNNNNQFY